MIFSVISSDTTHINPTDGSFGTLQKAVHCTDSHVPCRLAAWLPCTRVPDPPSWSASVGPSHGTPCALPILHHHLTSDLGPISTGLTHGNVSAHGISVSYLVFHQANALFWKARINALQLGDEQNVWQEHLRRGTNQRELRWELWTHPAMGRRKKSCNN